MTALTVIEPKDGGLALEISRRLTRLGAADVAVSSAGQHDYSAADCDILVVSADCVPAMRPPVRKPRCGILLQPGCGSPFTDARCVVTYGMSPICTLTLSSIGSQKCVLALQREIVTASGGILDRQELRIGAGRSADELLAVSGALLLLGLTPE